MNIVLVATECFPFAKITGLGDLVSVIAKSLEKEGNNVKVFIPRYGSIDPGNYHVERIPLELKVNSNGSTVQSSIFKGILPDSLASVFFIESQNHFSNSKEIYFSPAQFNETNNRNSFFCAATLEAISKLKFNTDIIHFFNPSCAQLAKIFHSKFAENPIFKDTKLIFTLQNIDELSDDQSILNYTKDAIKYSDYITTTSETFENELLVDIHNTGIANELEKKRNCFSGILSTLDEETYDPEKDSYIVQTFSKSYFSGGKKKCKEDLFEVLELEKDIQTPLFGVITRLTRNSGIDILIDNIPEIAELNLQLVLMGKGEEQIEERLTKLSKIYKNIKVCIGYNHNFGKKIYAGSDFYLCPEEKQIDGAPGLIALKYGSIPIAYKSGATKEIISDIDSREEANGIIFENYSKEALLESINKAIKYYKNKESWTKLVKQAMSFNTCTSTTAKKYINCYEIAINAKKSQEESLSK